MTDFTQVVKDAKTDAHIGTLSQNVSEMGSITTGLVASIAGVAGILLVGFGLYKLYKLSKDGNQSRESPLGPIVAIFVGGALLAAIVIMLMINHSILA